ncbi:voltage-dependent anion channel-domain-containing protein [Tricladium varicosporioides]|nr:voltage-dependent anion channel-domain-containing protein [Hymenoscyphus varicosporioides]
MNGYESPLPIPNLTGFFGNGTPGNEERRRNTYAGNDNEAGDSKKLEFLPEENVEDNQPPSDGDGGNDKKAEKYGIRDRIGCYTWTWFTMTMATGGIANMLHSIPYGSNWLRIIGTVVFLFNITLFIINSICLTLRFQWNKGSLKASFTSPSESLFAPASLIAGRLGTILTNMAQYGLPHTGEWFQTTMQVLYWFYASISFISSSGMYLLIWSTQTFPIHTMTPIWIFPAYPLLLLAPFASNLIDCLPDAAAAARINSVAIAFSAISVQGTGFLVSLMIYSAFIYRLMTQKLPRETSRPGMFVSVGPSGFTVAGLVNLGNTAMPKIMPGGYMNHTDTAFTLKIVSDMIGLWIWGLCLWFFLVSVGAHWQLMQPRDSKHHIRFDMTWYSFVFPNTALVTATLAIGKSLSSDAIQIFGTVLAGLIIILWLIIFGLMIRSILTKQILFPTEIDGSEISMNKWIVRLEEGMRNLRVKNHHGGHS